MSLSEKRCIPCEGGVPALTLEQATDLMPQIPEWKLSEDGRHLSRLFGFKDFAAALTFTNKVGEVAEEQWHHPDIKLSWGKVEITLTTHSIKGLSENDFIVAAHIDLLSQ
jgi:4a-hydroxytetrahydrobiopterin dehydratase